MSIKKLHMSSKSPSYLCLNFLVYVLTGSFFEEDLKAEPIAVNTEDTGVAICTGYDPVQNRWGPWGERLNDKGEDDCPAGQAFMAHAYVSGSRWREIDAFPVSGFCCKLPNGVLLEEQVYVPEQCPDDFVVTGGRVKKDENSGAAMSEPDKYLFRCTRIDCSKFTLGPPTPGWSVSLVQGVFDRVMHILRFGVPQHVTTRSRIPLALRYGIFRTGPFTWDEDGCIGHPWGSILTGRKSKNCSGYIFRELLYTQTSPEHSAQVQMYPACTALSSPFDVNATCISP